MKYILNKFYNIIKISFACSIRILPYTSIVGSYNES